MAFDVDGVAERLPNRMVLWLEETDSTMLDAARLAESGFPSGSVVGAELQTAGQGRLGRSWHSEKGNGLYFTVVLRLPLAPDSLPMATMAVGLALGEAISQVSGVAVDLRWPNDILIGEKKVCGILVQQHPHSLACGVGVNVNQSSFPDDIASIATSLRIATGKEISREDLFLQALSAMDRHLEILVNQGKEAILRLFTAASSYVSGRRVVVDQASDQLRGTTAGLDANGFLILRRDDGSRTLILAGGVRPE